MLQFNISWTEDAEGTGKTVRGRHFHKKLYVGQKPGLPLRGLDMPAVKPQSFPREGGQVE